MQFWTKKTENEINEKVFNSLERNVSFYDETILGVPASHLDVTVFNRNKGFLQDKPFLTTLINNPNHIGCHTLDTSENFFSGTQEIEREVIQICAYDILKGNPQDKFDGYVASGGTEANLQAIWAYRNFFQQKYGAELEQIAIISSSDTHYSAAKASNVFSLQKFAVQIDENTRKISEHELKKTLSTAQEKGVRYFIVIANMMTTMFGSVDNVDVYTKVLEEKKLPFKLHVDGAYGGFYYPFSVPNHALNFSNPAVSSVTLDAHKMAQAPYGTGIIIFRKGYINYTNTSEAKYVAGEDYTLVGSRSGANAVAIWMILASYGPHGWYEKILVLKERTRWLTQQLSNLGVDYFNEEGSNIVTIKAACLSKEIADQFILVPDNHQDPKWFKIVVMEHVTLEKLEVFINAVRKKELTALF